MKVFRTLAFLLVALSLVLAACAPAATEAPVVEATEAATEARCNRSTCSHRSSRRWPHLRRADQSRSHLRCLWRARHLWRSHPALLHARHGICNWRRWFRW